MSGLFSVGSPVVAATLFLLISLSIATWSIAIFKVWKQVQVGKLNRDFKQAFWDARDWQSAAGVVKNGAGDFALLGGGCLAVKV